MSELVSASGSRIPLDPETIRVIVETAVPLIQELVKRIAESQSQIQEVLKKVDQLILREINSAFDALRDATLTDNAETRERRLNFAEDQLLRCTGLELNTKIGGRPSAYWVGLSHFGLFTISKLRGDEMLAVRHVLKTFATDPETARASHFPEVYAKVFQPECTEERNWYVQRFLEVERDDFKGRVFAAKALKVGKGIALAGFAIWAMTDRNTRVAAQVTANQQLQKLDGEMKEITPEKYREIMKEKVKAEFEEKLNQRCRSIAQSMLA